MSPNGPRVKVGLTIDPDLHAWVEAQVEAQVFANFSHAVNRALYLLRESQPGQ